MNGEGPFIKKHFCYFYQMHKSLKKALFCLLILLTSTTLVRGQKPVIITDQTEDILVGEDHIAILEDTTASLDIADVIYDYSEKFKINKEKYPVNVNKKANYWLRFKVTDSSTANSKLVVEVLDPHIEDLSFYERAPGSATFVERRTGLRKDFDTRAYKHKNYVFDLKLRSNQENTFYFRLNSRTNVGFFFKIRSNKYFDYYANNEYYLLGMYYGIIAIMAIYNLLIFFSIREKVYIYYVLYVVSCAVLSLLEDGTGFQYLWPSAPVVSSIASFSARLLLLGFFVLYSQSFLNLPQLSPKMNKVILGSVLLYFAYFTVEQFSGYRVLNDYFFIIPFLLIYTSSILVWKRGYRPARFFILGFSMVLVSIFIIVLRDQGLVQNNLQNAFLDKVIVYALNIGLVFEIVILSFALADRIKYMKIDRERAQKRIIHQLRENEKLKDKVNRELEQKVQERTRELNEKNKAIIDSITYAKRIQEAVLPKQAMLDYALKDHFVLYMPKDIVSGDFYWVELLSNKVLFAAVDCTGHGVPGALMSILGHNTLNSAVNELRLSKPGEILDAINEKLKETIKQNPDDYNDQFGLDIALCALDRDENILEYAGAFNSMYIVRNGKLKEIKADRFPIGHYYGDKIRDNFTNHKIGVKQGDQIYIFSDGYADQFGGKEKKKFLKENFKALISEVSDKPMAKQKELLAKRIHEWMGDFEQIDDILVMGIRV